VFGNTGLYAYVHRVTLYVGDAVRFAAVTAEVAFTPPDLLLPINVLGRRGFLDRVRVGVDGTEALPMTYLGFGPS
jgi:hypothetical protein